MKDDSGSEPDQRHPTPGAAGDTDAREDAHFALARALEVARRRFVERVSATEIQRTLGITAKSYTECMRWLLRSVMPRVSAGDCEHGFDRRLIALADSHLVGIAQVQTVNDHLAQCQHCAAYLRGLRDEAHVFITGTRPSAEAAKAPYVVPSLHSSQVADLRRTARARTSAASSRRSDGTKPSPGRRQPSGPVPSRHPNAPLIGIGGAAAITAVALWTTLAPSPPATPEIHRATADADRRDASPEGVAAHAVVAGGVTVGESATAAATPREASAPRLPPVVVVERAVDPHAREAGIASAEPRALAARYTPSLAPATVDGDAAHGMSDARHVASGASTTQLAVAPTQLPSIAMTQQGTAPEPVVPVPPDPAPTAAAPTPTVTGAEPDPAAEPSERIVAGSTPLVASDRAAAAGTFGIDAVAHALHEVRDALRSSLSDHAERLQALVCAPLAPAAGPAPTSGLAAVDAASAVSPAPASEPASHEHEDAYRTAPDRHVTEPDLPCDVDEGSWSS